MMKAKTLKLPGTKILDTHLESVYSKEDDMVNPTIRPAWCIAIAEHIGNQTRTLRRFRRPKRHTTILILVARGILALLCVGGVWTLVSLFM